MKLGRIFRFEFAYQLRRPATWLYFVVLFVVAWSIIQANYADDARNGWMLLNAPLVIASTTVVAGMLWLFVAASIAGDAALARHRVGHAPAQLQRAGVQVPIPGRPFPRRVRAQRADPAGGTGGHAARHALARYRAGDRRPMAARGLRAGLRVHRAAERVHRHGGAVLLRGAGPPRHRQLLRQRGAVLRLDGPGGLRLRWCCTSRTWRACSTRLA